MKTEGPRGLAGGLSRFAATLLHRVYRNELYRLYAVDIEPAAAIRLEAPLEDTQVFIIESREDVERLVADGYEDVMSIVPLFRKRLESGAVAICVFVEKDFATIDWMAFSETAKLSFDQLPHKVDFARGEVCGGGAWTVPRFRRRRIATYRFSFAARYLQARGRTVFRFSSLDANIGSHRTVEPYGGRLVRVGRWRWLLWWSNWKEREVI